MCRSPIKAPPWFRNGRNTRHQRWLDERLHGITPRDFHPQGIVVCTVPGLVPPPMFHDAWYTISTSVGMTRELVDLASTEALLILCDVTDTLHVDHCRHLMHSMSTMEEVLGIEGPIRILVSHQAASDTLVDASDAEDRILAVASNLCSEGIDEFVMGGSAGSRLVHEVSSKLRVCRKRGGQLATRINEHRAALEQVSRFEDLTEHILWQYCRIMLRTKVPEVNLNIAPGVPSSIDGFTVGSLLGEGFVASVYKLKSPESSSSSDQVLKTIPKKEIKSVAGLVHLDNHIKVMKRLSSDDVRHPNLVKINEIYHTSTHICLRMEDAGPEDLHGRLVRRDRQACPLPVSQVISIIKQAIAALYHMHIKLGLAHRDIKPENFIVSEDGGDVTIKLTDFETALSAGANDTTSKSVGTFPFMAPEMSLGVATPVLPTDIWSLGVVLLEVLICSRCLEYLLDLPSSVVHLPASDKTELVAAIVNFFKAPSSLHTLLEIHLRPELRDVSSTSVLLLDATLQVSADRRWTASQLHEMASDLSS
jgi:hypothetical protein